MFMPCPHCRDLVAIDPATRLPPTMCARCGGALQEALDPIATKAADHTPAPGEPSLASLLRSGETDEDATPAKAESGGADAMPDEADGADLIAADAESGMAQTDAQPPVELPGETLLADADTTQTPDTDEPSVPVLMLAPPTLSFTRQVARAPTHPRTAKWQWAALVVLSLSLAVQVLIADRARLAADAGWRPLITRMCGVLGCSVPAWHQPGAFAMLSRDVSPIADVPGGLHVQATFRNDARWPQPWPVLLLSLSDADGRVLGARAFSPGEYLGATASQAELAPGQSARIALRLREPNPDVVAFSFDFR